MIGNRMAMIGGRGQSESHSAGTRILDLEKNHLLQPTVFGDIAFARSQFQ